MTERAAAAPRGPYGAWLCLLVALALEVVRVGSNQDTLDPIYLPVALELLDAPEHFRVQQVGHYPPANSSLGSRSETFLLMQPWPRAQPLLRASYPPFATQQVVPPRVTEPHRRPVPWDVRAVSVEAAVTPAEPYARVLFHLKGRIGHQDLAACPVPDYMPHTCRHCSPSLPLPAISGCLCSGTGVPLSMVLPKCHHKGRTGLHSGACR